jgi:hypothetical protein
VAAQKPGKIKVFLVTFFSKKVTAYFLSLRPTQQKTSPHTATDSNRRNQRHEP